MVKRMVWLLLAGVLASCATWQSPTRAQWSQYAVEGNATNDAGLTKLLQPYADSVGSKMNEQLGVLEVPLQKSDDANSLGYFVADALLWGAKKTYGKADLAIMNQGGIRLPQLSAGALTRGKLYELMPFDNVLVLIDISGSQLQQLIAERKGRLSGWPVAGLSSKKTGNDRQWYVGNQPLHAAATYALAISDYLADGGDDQNMLKQLPRQNKGYLQRDAVLDYVAWHQANGRAVPMPQMDRILP